MVVGGGGGGGAGTLGIKQQEPHPHNRAGVVTCLWAELAGQVWRRQ